MKNCCAGRLYLNPGDLSWNDIEQSGELVVYDGHQLTWLLSDVVMQMLY